MAKQTIVSDKKDRGSKQAGEERLAKLVSANETFTLLDGRSISGMSKKELDELVLAIFNHLGIAATIKK